MTTKRKAQKTFREPLRYEVGKDISAEQYEELIVKVSDWFREWRNTAEPSADARMRIRCCLEGKTLDGQPWYSHWQSTFATRMRMLCRFDVDKMQPIRTGDEKKKAKKEREKQKETARRQANVAAQDPFIPPLTKRELDGRVAYGDNAMAVLTDNERENWQKFHDAYTAQFPELRSVNAQAELAMLCDLHLVHERNRLKLLAGQQIDPIALQDTTKAIADLKKGLGIHPDQLAKRVKEETGGSIGDAVLRMAALPNRRELKEKFLAEEWLLLYQMYHTPSPREDMDGYQLDEAGLFAHTRCRTCACAHCGERNFVGFSISEVEAHLEKKGYLTPEPTTESNDSPAAPDVPEESDETDAGRTE